jgi:hypothetical protein
VPSTIEQFDAPDCGCPQVPYLPPCAMLHTPPQQSDAETQVSPFCWQNEGEEQTPLVGHNPEQHWLLLVQGLPRLRHDVLRGEQVPEEHRPLQHWTLPPQACPSGVHAPKPQAPLVHAPLQQSDGREHPPPGPRQLAPASGGGNAPPLDPPLVPLDVPPPLETPLLDPLPLEAPPLEAPLLEALPLEAPLDETPLLEPLPLAAPLLERVPLEAPLLETPPLEAPVPLLLPPPDELLEGPPPLLPPLPLGPKPLLPRRGPSSVRVTSPSRPPSSDVEPWLPQPATTAVDANKAAIAN